MKRCLNCLEFIDDDAQKCPYCGAKNDSGEGYILLSEVQAPERKYQDVSSGKKHGPARFIVILVLILALVAGGSHYYFNSVSNPTNPTVKFSSGAGIINKDKKVVYVSIKDSSLIEYIQGVSAYKGNITDKEMKNAKPLSTDYEYTDNIDDSFRTIFFYADDLNVVEGKTNTFTFKINLSFVKDSNVYTYTVVSDVDGDITEDASDIVFDHSLKKEETTLAYDVTTVNHSNTDYIFDGYWYTTGVKDSDGKYKITAIKFNESDGSCVMTEYTTTNINGDWTVNNTNGTYSINNGILSYSGSDISYVVNSDDKTLIQDINDSKKLELTHTNYNNTSNAYLLIK